MYDASNVRVCWGVVSCCVVVRQSENLRREGGRVVACLRDKSRATRVVCASGGGRVAITQGWKVFRATGCGRVVPRNLEFERGLFLGDETVDLS